ncbi:hypothetical protein SXCC_00906 [Gluconacetobacter sp. SXCC-1]|nr:hypothetical protein SXCC_00906 [Gluconacetobacter sp. SXCC-1]
MQQPRYGHGPAGAGGFYRVGADQARQGGAQLAVARWGWHGGPWQQAFTPGGHVLVRRHGGRAVAGFRAAWDQHGLHGIAPPGGGTECHRHERLRVSAIGVCSWGPRACPVISTA